MANFDNLAAEPVVAGRGSDLQESAAQTPTERGRRALEAAYEAGEHRFFNEANRLPSREYERDLTLAFRFDVSLQSLGLSRPLVTMPLPFGLC